MTMIAIKSSMILFSIMSQKFDHTLLLIVWDFLERLDELEHEKVITSAFRKDSVGVHGTIPCRGIDFRSRGLRTFEIEDVVDYINTRWIYDPARPELKVIIHHDTGRGPHFHLQSHARTKRAEGV